MTSIANNPKNPGLKLIETSFAEMNAVQKLSTLAKIPYDLSVDGNLNAERIDRFKAHACGYTMLYATERIDKNCMDSLFELAKESYAFEQMEQMQSGEIVNFMDGFPSEQRAALHTATRDFFDNPNQAQEAVKATKDALNEINKLKSFINKIDEENRWEHILVVGIGGSELGPKAHYEALQAYLKPGRSASFLSNIDPDALEMIVRNCDLAKTLVLIISKTGTTLETLTNEEILRARFESVGLQGKDHFISVTCPKSPLDDPQKYREVFFMWDWVGGRYSTTSMVGGVLLAFAFGFDSFWELLRGANAMDKVALEKSLDKNLPLLAALLGIWNRNFLNHSHIAIIPYSQALARFPAHIQQLDMESNGKHVDKMGRLVTFDTGPIIFGEPGTSAQHSFYQLIHQGTTPIPLEFITFKEPQLPNDRTVNGTTSQQKLLSNVFAQTIALATGQKNENPNKSFQGNRPSFLLIGQKLTAFALGALLSFYENKVAFQGFIWHTNSFDQEGVQLGKILATKILDRFSGHGSEYPLG
ncbi:MAG: glucose-6-phosphate isomerase, partial [Parachlamydiaceae bacterium]|nr:glucose-6-phosphate isomerase [Parachlamydiaceae bacterium]